MVRLVPLALLVAACGGQPPRPGIPPRHALLVTIEGLRADHSSAYLYHRETTTFPIDEAMRVAGSAVTIDELAHSGTLFTQAFAPTGHPLDSLGALLSGNAPDPTQPPGRGFDAPAGPTLVGAFVEAGFETAAFVAWSDVYPELPGPWTAGFEVARSAQTDQEVLIAAIEHIGDLDWSDGRGRFTWIHLRGPAFPFEPYPLTNHRGQEVDYASLFTDPAYAGDVGEGGGTSAYDAVRGGTRTLDAADRQHLTDLYDGELALTGYLLFYFLDYLRYDGITSGAWDSTVTVVAGTSGVELDERFGVPPWVTLRDSSLRVPLLLRHPDSLTGRRIFSELVTLDDVAPTLADWFGLDWTAGTGRSLLAVTDTYVERDFEPRPAFAASRMPGRERVSIRTADWRLVADAARLARDGDGALELYRIERMRETGSDVADRHPHVARELLEALRRRWSAGSE